MVENLEKFEKKFVEGEIIVSEGSLGNEFYIVKEGELEIYKTSKSKKIIQLAHIGTGDFFGETALFESRKRDASVRTLKPTVLYVFNKETLQDVFKISPNFALKIIDGLVNKIFNMNKKYLELLNKAY